MSHTPGKWETGGIMTRVEVWPPGWNAPVCVADCHTKQAPDNEAERVANASLIAAAPALLGACRAAIDDLEWHQEQDAEISDCDPKDVAGKLRAECISYGELFELQSLAAYIEPGDVELLEAAGVPEFPEEGGHA